MSYAEKDMDAANRETYGLRDHPQSITEGSLGIQRKKELEVFFIEIGRDILEGRKTVEEFAQEQAERHLQMEMESEHDPLTGLLNRRGFVNHFDQLLLTFRRDLHLSEGQDTAKTPGCLVILDLDNFGLVNKRYGEHVGDATLQQVAATLLENVRPEDFIARIGGEEFILFLSGASLKDACNIVERIRKNLPHQTAKKLENLLFAAIEQAASLGVIQLPDDLTEQELFEPERRSHIFHNSYREAIRAMREAKKEGRDRVVITHNNGSLETITPTEPLSA